VALASPSAQAGAARVAQNKSGKINRMAQA
jgi:hypothetical protein